MQALLPPMIGHRACGDGYIARAIGCRVRRDFLHASIFAGNATACVGSVSISATGQFRPGRLEEISMEWLIPIVLFVCIVVAIHIIMDGRVRRRIAESGASEDLVRTMLAADERNRAVSSLKWGLVLVLVGIAFGLIDLLNLRQDDPATFGIVIAAAGLGMLGFHMLAARKG
ncbi:MAG: hypothetical protein IPK27_18215 [Rhodanobacteraceae bacterium]|nr:hypothetical protein [Rhodanobacteraceae bacterium]